MTFDLLDTVNAALLFGIFYRLGGFKALLDGLEKRVNKLEKEKSKETILFTK
jgi:hypothetical protein